MKKVSQAVIYGKFFDFPCSQVFLNAFKPLSRTYVITVDEVHQHPLRPYLNLLQSLMQFDIIDKIRHEDIYEWDYFTILVDVMDYSSFETIMRQIASGRPYIHIWHPYATFDTAKGKAGTYDEA